MITYKFTFSIGYTGAEHEDEFEVQHIGKGYTDNEWNALDEKEREKLVFDEWEQWIWNYIDGSQEIIKTGDEN